MPNQLAHETSPYLLQHANNPVDWHPWGTEALEKSKDEDPPAPADDHDYDLELDPADMGTAFTRKASQGKAEETNLLPTLNQPDRSSPTNWRDKATV